VTNNLAAIFGTYQTFFEGLLLFGIAFLITGFVVRALLRGIVYAWIPLAKETPSEQQETPARVALALVSFVAWMLALVFAAEVVSLHSVASFCLFLAAAVLVAPALIVAVSLIVYSFSKEGNQLVTGLIGSVYLRLNRGRRIGDRREFDLGDGKLGKVATVYLLQTSFTLPGREKELVSNARLMRDWFGMGKKLK
jgi:hypothetical protein